MDLLDWVGTLLRRWWLTVPLLLLALTASGATAVVTPWKYEAKATAVLLASPVQAKEAGGNPWLVFDSSLTVTAEVVGREMMDERTAAALRAKGLTATYMVGVAPDSTGPVLAIEVTGTDAAGTKATLDALLATVPDRLAKLQAQESVAPRAQIKMNVIAASPKAAMVATDKIRLVVMTLFLGLVVTVALPLFAEVLSERRRRNRGEPEVAEARTAAPSAPDRRTPEAPKPSTREAAPRPARNGATPRVGIVGRPDETLPDSAAPTAARKPTARPKAKTPDTPEGYGLLGSPDPAPAPASAPASSRGTSNGSGPHRRPDVSEISEPDA